MHYAVGDIHGCLYALRSLVEDTLCVTDKDFLIFLGDYIGRGPDSKQVIDYILNLQKLGVPMICLLGDHEVNLTTYLGSIDIVTGNLKQGVGINMQKLLRFFHHQAEPTLLSYADKVVKFSDNGKVGTLKYNIPFEHVDFIQKLQYAKDLKVNGRQFLCVHAGLRPGVNMHDQTVVDLVNIGPEWYGTSSRVPDVTVVFGHTPFSDGVFKADGKLGIDTGCGWGGKLTALRLEDLQEFQVDERPRIVV